jgi:hypothetical protein
MTPERSCAIVRDVSFDQAVAELRSLLGVEIGINITDDRDGIGDGYIADFSGKLSRVDDPVVNVDANVHYFRLDDGAGFGIHAEMFKQVGWTDTAGVRILEIELGEVVMRIRRV